MLHLMITYDSGLTDDNHRVTKLMYSQVSICLQFGHEREGGLGSLPVESTASKLRSTDISQKRRCHIWKFKHYCLIDMGQNHQGSARRQPTACIMKYTS